MISYSRTVGTAAMLFMRDASENRRRCTAGPGVRGLPPSTRGPYVVKAADAEKQKLKAAWHMAAWRAAL